jgi:hypothetical protein
VPAPAFHRKSFDIAVGLVDNQCFCLNVPLETENAKIKLTKEPLTRVMSGYA